jgi:hypothetical protein
LQRRNFGLEFRCLIAQALPFGLRALEGGGALGEFSRQLFGAKPDFGFVVAASAGDPENYRARGEAHSERNHCKEEHE